MLRNIPEFAQGYNQAEAQLNQMLMMAKQMFNIDPKKDIHYVTASLVLQRDEKKDPMFVMAVGGKIPPAVMQRLATMAKLGPPKKFKNGEVYEAKRKSDPSLGLTKDNVFLVGHFPLIKSLLKKTPRKSTASQLLKSMRDSNTGIAVAATLPKKLSGMIAKEVGPAFSSLFTNLGGVFWGMQYDGAKMALVAKKATMLPRYKAFLDGYGLYMVSSEFMLQALVKFAEGVLPNSTKGLKGKKKSLPEVLMAIIKYKKPILEYYAKVMSFGKPNAVTRVDKGKKRAEMIHTGNPFAQLFPGMIAAGTAIPFFIGRKFQNSLAAPPPTPRNP